MSREIKFRAWDKKENQMVGEGLEEFSIGFDGRLRFWHRIKKDYYPLDDDFVVMQFTGLKDKNGKEIYEGDIVKHPVLGYEDPNVGEVRYVNAAFLVVNDDWEEITYRGEGRKTFTLSSLEKYEVVGNIYQNPVLLGKNKEPSQN